MFPLKGKGSHFQSWLGSQSVFIQVEPLSYGPATQGVIRVHRILKLEKLDTLLQLPFSHLPTHPAWKLRQRENKWLPQGLNHWVSDGTKLSFSLLDFAPKGCQPWMFVVFFWGGGFFFMFQLPLWEFSYFPFQDFNAHVYMHRILYPCRITFSPQVEKKQSKYGNRGDLLVRSNYFKQRSTSCSFPVSFTYLSLSTFKSQGLNL